ncbi:hypothetical protein [Blastococcus sp. VKM Ac-2987]|uniref:hypothetical protein n=1 Tax=Blastococcus sp. VKM Ac-2987 TaxID=3004141 RepID=UPI0022ABC16A|nr:hypothetical protein [Blastococcus sp. VKM Ac-2987]MCZ2857452.1 hypothetical protein [Blastococcus sp. VKM Ac-2987]
MVIVAAPAVGDRLDHSESTTARLSGVELSNDWAYGRTVHHGDAQQVSGHRTFDGQRSLAADVVDDVGDGSVTNSSTSS